MRTAPGQVSPSTLSLTPSTAYYKPLCCLLSQGLVSYTPPDWGEADWQAVIALARDQGVAALLYWRLRSATFQLPPLIMKSLASVFYDNLAQQTLCTEALAAILAAMEKAKIPLVLLKGAELAYRLYPDAGTRPMADLDLMVSRANLARAVMVFQGLGYQLQKMTYHAVFIGGPGDQVSIELHWGLATSPVRPNSPARTWFEAQVEPYDLPAGRALVLRPATTLLYLSAHLDLQHGGPAARLIWYYDLLLLLQQWGEDLDWAELSRYAFELGWQQALVKSLAGVMQRFPDVLPEKVRECIAALPANHQPLQAGGPVDGWVLQALEPLDWRSRLQIAWHFLFPSPRYIRWRYQPKPGWLWPAWYLVRWVEGMKIVKISKSQE